MVKISVIVPIYNGEFYIQEALDSLVNQTIIEDIEVIMVDDGSTDNSRYIIDKYALDYENFFAYHLENKGVTFARNWGIDLAKGEYIHLMDADDYLHPNAYEKLYELASKYNHDVVMGNFLRFNSRRTWETDIPNFVFENIPETIQSTTLVENNRLTWDMFIWNKLYKRDFLNENNIRFPYKNLTFQDNLFSIQVYVKAKTIGMLHDYIYFWRARENNSSITQVINIKWALDRFEILNMVHNFVSENILDNDVEYTKYLKWLDLDLPNLINRVKDFPKKDHLFLLENLHQIINLVPNEYFNNLSSYNKVLFSMVKNRDWDDLMKFISYDLKRNPNINMKINEKYISELTLNKDCENEKLNVNGNSLSFNDGVLKIKCDYRVNYLDKSKPHSLSAFLMTGDDEFYLSEVKNNEIYVPINILDLKDYRIKIVYKSNSMIKESFLKTNSRNVFNINNYYCYIYYDKKSNFHLKKMFSSNNDIYHIKELTFDDEKISFYGEYNNTLTKIKIKDILSFTTDFCSIDYDNNKFKFDIFYDDLLNSPVKRWELNGFDESVTFKLDKSYEIYQDKYFVQVKNHGCKILIELHLYDKLIELNKKLKN